MLTQALKVIGPVRGNILKAAALALRNLAGSFLAFWVEVLVILEFMVAEALGLWAHHLALTTLAIAPRHIQSILAFF